LKGKVFIKGPTQAAKYDEAFKSYITFVGTKYGQQVKRAFIHKNRAAGTRTMNNPKVSMIRIIKQFSAIGTDSKMEGREVEVMDRESEAFFEYQLTLKQHLFDMSSYSNTLEICYSILLG